MVSYLISDFDLFMIQAEATVRFLQLFFFCFRIIYFVNLEFCQNFAEMSMCLICGFEPQHNTLETENVQKLQDEPFLKWKLKTFSAICDILQLKSPNSCYVGLLREGKMCDLCLKALREIEMAYVSIKNMEKRLFQWVTKIKSIWLNHSKKYEDAIATNQLYYMMREMENRQTDNLMDFINELSPDKIVCLLRQSKLNSHQYQNDVNQWKASMEVILILNFFGCRNSIGQTHTVM